MTPFQPTGGAKWPLDAKNMIGLALALGGTALTLMLADRDMDLCTSLWGDCSRVLGKECAETYAAEIWGNDGDFGGEG